MYGEPETFSHDWRMKLKIPGLCVTDAKSLLDHLGKTGNVPKEKQTLIDLLTARDLVEQKAVLLRWMPNRHMLADMLTKQVKPTKIVDKFFVRESVFCGTFLRRGASGTNTRGVTPASA